MNLFYLRFFIFMLIIGLSYSCNELDATSTYTVTFKAMEATTSSMGGTTTVSGATASVRRVRSNNSLGSEDATGTTGSDGTISLTLQSGLNSITFGAPDSSSGQMSAIVYINATRDVDLSSYPVILPSLEASSGGRFCDTDLNISDTGGWLRVYETSATLSDSDSLTIAAVTSSASSVDSGNDLVTNTTANNSLSYLDVYNDSTISSDSIGHRDVDILDSESGNSTYYTATLNSASLIFRINYCGGGALTIIYF